MVGKRFKKRASFLVGMFLLFHLLLPALQIPVFQTAHAAEDKITDLTICGKTHTGISASITDKKDSEHWEYDWDTNTLILNRYGYGSCE